MVITENSSPGTYVTKFMDGQSGGVNAQVPLGAFDFQSACGSFWGFREGSLVRIDRSGTIIWSMPLTSSLSRAGEAGGLCWLTVERRQGQTVETDILRPTALGAEAKGTISANTEMMAGAMWLLREDGTRSLTIRRFVTPASAPVP